MKGNFFLYNLFGVLNTGVPFFTATQYEASGGGIKGNGGIPQIIGNVFHVNYTGIANYEISPWIVNNVILWCGEMDSRANLIYGRNEQKHIVGQGEPAPAGIYNEEAIPNITNNTIVENEYGIYSDNIDTLPNITNNIIVQNWVGIFDELEDDPPSPSPYTYNDVWDNDTDYGGATPGPGPNSISEDPLFSGDPEGGDPYTFLLNCESPAVNAGANTPPGGFPTTDIFGNPRVIDGTVDMGAFEANCAGAIKKHPQLPSLLPTAQNNISKSNDLLKQADDLLTQAKEKGLDTGECQKIIDEATELIDMAKKSLTNPIYANNLALQALEKLKQAIDCLKALLG